MDNRNQQSFMLRRRRHRQGSSSACAGLQRFAARRARSGARDMTTCQMAERMQRMAAWLIVKDLMPGVDT
jgi:hypothetical protein